MLLLLLSVALLILCLSTTNYRRLYLAFKIPGPIPLPVLGNALLFYDKSPAEIRIIGERIFERYGDIFTVWIGSQLTVTVSDRKLVEHVLSSPEFNQKSSAYSLVTSWLNDGVLLSKGSKWYKRRKIIMPAFHFRALEQYVSDFDRESCVFVDTLSKFNKTDKIELSEIIRLYSLDIICETAMGVKVNAQQQSDSEYVNAVDTILKIVNRRIFSIVHRLEFSFRFTDSYKKQENALKTLHGFTDKVIRERRQKLLDGTAHREDTKVENTLLDILLKSTIDGKPLTDRDIQEEVDTLMVEGHDTIKSGLTFCFYSIAKHPEVQRKCFQEIRDILGDDCTKPVTLNDLNNLSYLDLVIKETLRLFPPIPMTGRWNEEEANLGGYTIPKGTDIIIITHFLTHNPKVFPDPLEFRPERFLGDGSDEKLSFYSHFPFSTGLRKCIGEKYALLEMKTLITKMLRHFELSLAEESKVFPSLVGEVVLSSEEEIYFHLQPRLYE